MKNVPNTASDLSFTRQAPIEETSNTQLAAALVTLGIPVNEKSGGAVRLVGDGITAPGGTVAWIFEPVSECGRYRTSEMMKLWNDKSWLTDPNNDHPLAFIACAMHNYRALVDKIHNQTPLGVVKKGCRHALINLNASQHLQDIVFRRL